MVPSRVLDIDSGGVSVEGFLQTGESMQRRGDSVNTLHGQTYRTCRGKYTDSNAHIKCHSFLARILPVKYRVPCRVSCINFGKNLHGTPGIIIPVF